MLTPDELYELIERANIQADGNVAQTDRLVMQELRERGYTRAQIADVLRVEVRNDPR